MSNKNLRLSPPMPFKEVREWVQNAVLLAGAATLLAYPMFFHQYQRLLPGLTSRQLTLQQFHLLAMGNSFMLFAAAFLSSLMGFFYAHRLNLPGFGKFTDLLAWAPLGLGACLILAPPTYFFFDREMMRRVPELFPSPWPWALATMAGSAISQEVIGRFGLLTVGVYLLRWRNFQGHPWPAMIVISLFSAASSFLFSSRFHLDHRMETYQLVVPLVSTFIMQWIFSEIYLRRGLLAAVGFHLGLAAKLVIYALVL